MPVPQDDYRHCENCQRRWKVWHFEPFPGDPPEVAGWCASCRRTEHYVRSAEIERKRCARCGRLKRLDEFTSHKTSRDRVNSWCEECRRFPGLRPVTRAERP